MKASAILRKSGMANASIIVQAARETGVPLDIAAAFAHQESGGHHIYGHDLGGVFSTNGTAVIIGRVTYPARTSTMKSDIPVTSQNFAEFIRRVVVGGQKSNGVGIFQITYAGKQLSDGGRAGGYFKQADDLGYDLSDPLDNSRFALGHIIGPYLNGNYGDAKIAEAATRYNTGSYTGTGTYGSSNPNSLTFSFPPEFLVVSPNQEPYRLFLVRGMTKSNTSPTGGSNGNVAVAWDSNTVSWYGDSNGEAYLQLNARSKPYFYFAIG